MLSAEVERFANFQRSRFERRLSHGQIPQAFIEPPIELPSTETLIIDADLVRDSKERIMIVLITINGVILFLSGGLGYLLAGKTLKPIQSMIDEQNRFVSDASHELRTPLTSIKTATEVALRDPDFSLHKAKVLIKDNLAEVEHLQSLSEKLLELGQSDNQNTDIKLEQCDITPIVNEVIKTIKPQADQKGISFIVNLHNSTNNVTRPNGQDVHTIRHPDSSLKPLLERGRSDPSIPVTGGRDDHESVEQNPKSVSKEFSSKTIQTNSQMFHTLITIIIDNAVKYSDKPGTITIQSLHHDKQYILRVIDEGKGIDPLDLPHIFDRFYRADSARSKSTVFGYGLGLSIAQKIMTLHKGEIVVESQIGKGSIFTLKFPVFS